MTATHETHGDVYPAHYEPPVGPTRRLLFGPGLLRGAWMAVLFFGLGTLLVCALRWWWSWDPVWNTEVVLAVAAMTFAPIGFLAGIGSFDYWLHYVAGRPTRPEDHSGHGAHSWRDYFRVNTDHKVIGIQYLVTTFVFFAIGGLMPTSRACANASSRFGPTAPEVPASASVWHPPHACTKSCFPAPWLPPLV